MKSLRKPNELIETILKETPLHTRIKVALELYFLHKKYNGETEKRDIDRIQNEAIEEAESLVHVVLGEVKGWIEDGLPGELKISEDEERE